ncbi:PQQ-dependent sugar dehydrogenase [Porphyrobacter algicida]|uniref:PQQ-dependent sugar dehydrogenase n=1 Tax=Qipengyuania algicida TaxID=1836209 RepID=A0A845AIA8_9SPHN|nr:PQQ-dependent sugar dehydrogenase [Qipengyuania algicida]MXP29179.1 PQQ-dependent sugar dehydrogenase [Qipengyuania algicida]
MRHVLKFALILSPLALAASCGAARSGDSAPAGDKAAQKSVEIERVPAQAGVGFIVQRVATLNEPWAASFAPGTPWLFVTEKNGTIKAVDTENHQVVTVGGAPKVDYGGQGGLGDIAFLPWESMPSLGTRTIYLSWAEEGPHDTRGAVLGRGKLVCDQSINCSISDLKVIWRQTPKVSGRGHYSHRIAFSPDRKHLFIASGERQKGQPAQDPRSDLGKILRLNLDGTPAAGNVLADENVARPGIYSLGHRNILGLRVDSRGRLWDLEHGPAGGDELNLVTNGSNYGWPYVSEGDHYSGQPIARHATQPQFNKPAISWTPVIAPGDFIFYSGTMFPALDGEALIAGLKSKALIRVAIRGDTAREVARYPLGSRLREIAEGPDGAIWILEDGGNAGLLRLTPG